MAGCPDGISGYNTQARQSSAAVDVAEVPMSAMPIASRPVRSMVAAVLLAAGCAVAPPSAPAADRNVPADPSRQGDLPASANPSLAPLQGKQSPGPPSQPRYSVPQYGGYGPSFCYYYPVNCARPMPYPFYSYPPSYYLSPGYSYAWPYGGGGGLDRTIGPVFGFAPGIILYGGFAFPGEIHVRRVIGR